MKKGDRWPARPETETVVVDESSWSIDVTGFCSVEGGDFDEALHFTPKVVVELRLGGKKPVVTRAIPGRKILSPNPADWQSAVTEARSEIREYLERRSAPESREALEQLVAAADRARAAAAKAMVSAQAAYLISIIPSLEATSAWREAEVRMILET